MAANAAFLLGLVLGIAPDVDRLISGLTFTHARRNFYEAARRGLAAALLWRSELGRRAGPVTVPALIERLLPVAARGLRDHGVDGGETDRLLGVIADRARAGQTGATSQRALLARTRDPARVVEGAPRAPARWRAGPRLDRGLSVELESGLRAIGHRRRAGGRRP